MESNLSGTASHCLVIEFMTKPVEEQLKQTNLSTQDVKESVATLDTVLQMLSTSSLVSKDKQSLELEWEEMLLRLYKDICYPMLFSLKVFPANQTERSSDKSKAFSIISRLMVEAAKYFSDATLAAAITQMFVPVNIALQSATSSFLDKKDSSYKFDDREPLPLLYSLELISAVVSSPNLFSQYLESLKSIGLNRDKVLTDLFDTLSEASLNESTFCKTFIIIGKVLPCCNTGIQENQLSKVWTAFCQPIVALSAGVPEKQAVWRSLYVCYCLRDHLFPLDLSGQMANRMSNTFWTILQAGLLSQEPSDRKLGMYLFKRLVDTCTVNNCDINATLLQSSQEEPIFWWSASSSKELVAVWEDFTLLIETLEEKQIHIIKPLLPKIQKIVAACCTKASNGLSLFHCSWLVTLITRSFQHESYFLSRWGAHVTLTLDFDKVPLMAHRQLKFLSHDLVEYLQENKLYSRYEGTELGKSSPIGEALRSFFDNLFKSMNKDQKVKYLLNVFHIVQHNTWGSVPLVFVFEGLSHISRGAILNSHHLTLIRTILQACLATLEPMARGAIQCFACHMIINLMDLSSVTVWEVFDTLASVNRDESLQRGTLLWDALVHWLSEESGFWEGQDIVAQVMAVLQGGGGDHHSNSVVFEGYQMVSLARMLMLTTDALEARHGTFTASSGDAQAGKSTAQIVGESPLAKVLAKVCQSFSGVRSRPYINTGLVDACLALLHCLSREAGSGSDKEVDKLLFKSLGESFPHAVFYTQHKLVNYLTQASDLDEIKFHSDALLSLGSHCSDLRPWVGECGAFVKAHVLPGVGEDAETMGKQDVLSCAALRVLAIVFKIISVNTVVDGEQTSLQESLICQTLSQGQMMVLPLPFSRKSVSKDSTSKKTVGRVISRFITSKWQCLKHVLVHTLGSDQAKVPVDALMEAAMEDMTIGSGGSDIAIYNALEMVAQQLVSSPTLVCQFLDLAWNKLMEEKKNALFWKKLEALVPVALHKDMMGTGDIQVEEGVKQLTSRLWALGCEKSGVNFIVMRRVFAVLNSDPQRKVAFQWMDVLVDAVAYGAVHKKGERLWLDVCAYIESLGPFLAVNQVLSSITKNDISTRILTLSYLSTFSPSEPCDQALVVRLTSVLWDRYLELARQNTYKQFFNSLTHREKHRLVLGLVLFGDFVTEDQSGQWLQQLWMALELECHPSVRQSLELLVMRLIIAHPHMVATVWEVFTLYQHKRSVCLCSVFLILSHLGDHLPQHMQAPFYSRALTSVIPWTMADHYNTRIFAQVTLMCLWKQCQGLGLTDVMDKHSAVQASLEFLCDNNNASATTVKLLNNFMYSGFHPLRDYSMETIFHTLPRLASLADDEWVLPDQFLHMDKSWKDAGGHHLPLYNVTDDLSKCAAGAWRMKAYIKSDEDLGDGDGDVQKKVMPWRLMAPDQETEMELANQRKKRSGGGVVVVTSLVDKVTNLGGLCRTSEIFGVSEFVVGNLTSVQDRLFQTLSVSAHKWINITEVHRRYVSNYLSEKRAQGYTLVGVEQTANSVALQEYSFPKKTLLLLGNEKEGIPVDVLQDLDVCVEIPQLGVIRSLNVHVCGALIIWEYTRQQIQAEQEANVIPLV